MEKNLFSNDGYISPDKIYLYQSNIKEVLEKGYTDPVTCEIDPSGKCQLACNFCFFKNSKDHSNLDFDLYERLISELTMLNIKSITFTGGGEPLMHPRIQEMIRSAAGKFRLGLITNGILLPKLFPDLFKEFDFIRISLNAPNRKIYKAIAGKDYFDTVISNIGFLLSNRNDRPTVGIGYVVVKENEVAVEEMKRLGEELKVDYVQFKQDVSTIAKDTVHGSLPCKISSLMAQVSSNGKIYYCCQHINNPSYEVGDLHASSLQEIYRKKAKTIVDSHKCFHCRYSAYAERYEHLMHLKHREFI